MAHLLMDAVLALIVVGAVVHLLLGSFLIGACALVMAGALAYWAERED